MRIFDALRAPFMNQNFVASCLELFFTSICQFRKPRRMPLPVLTAELQMPVPESRDRSAPSAM
jgi:hypothetical protein